MSQKGGIEEINSILKEYKNMTVESMKSAVDKISKDAVNELRSASPSGSGDYSDWSDYNKGWTATKSKGNSNSYEKIVHNSKKYRLTHLLEKGHARVNGGRNTRAFEHIGPVAEKVADELEKVIMGAIKGN